MTNKQVLFEQALKNNEFNKIVKENKLDYDCLNNILNFDAVEAFVDSCKIDCSKGDSLNDCKQDIKGKRITIFFKNKLFYCRTINCEHQNKYNDITGWKKNFVHKNFSWDVIEDIDKKKIPSQYKPAISKAQDIISGKNKKGLFIFGEDSINNNNFLKTIAYKISKLKTGSPLFEKNIYFDNFTNILGNIKDSFSENSKSINSISKIKSVDILFIDSLGSESPTQWSIEEVLLSIISHRVENKLLTFISSEYSISELCKYYEKIIKKTLNTKTNSNIKKISSYLKLLVSETKIVKS